MTGAELRTARKAAKVTQADLAKRVGVSRDAVQYWEAKATIGRRSAGERIAEALVCGLMPAQTRARGNGVLAGANKPPRDGAGHVLGLRGISFSSRCIPSQVAVK